MMNMEVRKQDEKVDEAIADEAVAEQPVGSVGVEEVIEEIRAKLAELSDAVARLTEAINVSVDVQRGLKESVEKMLSETVKKVEGHEVKKASTPRPIVTAVNENESDLLKDVLKGKLDWGSLSEKVKKERFGSGGGL